MSASLTGSLLSSSELSRCVVLTCRSLEPRQPCNESDLDRLTFDVRNQLAKVTLYPLHQICEVRQSPEKALVIYCIIIVSGLVQALETPSIKLCRVKRSAI